MAVTGPLKYIVPHYRVVEGDAMTGDLRILIETPDRDAAVAVYADARTRNGDRASWRVAIDELTLNATKARVRTRPIDHQELIELGLIAADS